MTNKKKAEERPSPFYDSVRNFYDCCCIFDGLLLKTPISNIKYSTVIKCFIYTKQYTVYSLVQIYSSWSDSPPDGSRVELLEHEIEQSIWNPDRYFNEVVWHLDELEFELKDSIAHPEYGGRPSTADGPKYTVDGPCRTGSSWDKDLPRFVTSVVWIVYWNGSIITNYPGIRDGLYGSDFVGGIHVEGIFLWNICLTFRVQKVFEWQTKSHRKKIRNSWRDSTKNSHNVKSRRNLDFVARFE